MSLFLLFLESAWPEYCCLSKFCEYVQVCRFARVLSLRTTAVCKYGSTLDNFSRLSFRLGPPKRHFGIIWGTFRHGGADPASRCPPGRHLEAQNELTGPSRSAVGAKRDSPRGPNGAKSLTPEVRKVVFEDALGRKCRCAFSLGFVHVEG